MLLHAKREDPVSLVLYMAGGFLGGLYFARKTRPLASIERRGALVFDGGEAQRATRKRLSKARWRALARAGAAPADGRGDRDAVRG